MGLDQSRPFRNRNGDRNDQIITPEYIQNIIKTNEDSETKLFNSNKEFIKNKLYNCVRRQLGKKNEKPLTTYKIYIRVKYFHLPENKVSGNILQFLRNIYEPQNWVLSLYKLDGKPSTWDSYPNLKIRMTSERKKYYIKHYAIILDIRQISVPNDKRCLYKTPVKLFREELCVICKDKHPELFYYPCAHHIICYECYQGQLEVGAHNCPLCNKLASSIVVEKFVPFQELIEKGLMDPADIAHIAVANNANDDNNEDDNDHNEDDNDNDVDNDNSNEDDDYDDSEYSSYSEESNTIASDSDTEEEGDKDENHIKCAEIVLAPVIKKRKIHKQLTSNIVGNTEQVQERPYFSTVFDGASCLKIVSTQRRGSL